MEMTQIAVLAVSWALTFALAFLVIKLGKRHPIVVVVTAAVLILTILVTLDIAGVSDIFGDLLTGTPGAPV